MAPSAGEMVMANSTSAGSPAQITAEYLSEHEPVALLIFQPLKLWDNSHQHAGAEGDMSTSTLSGIKSQKGQADRIRLTKQCKIIGQSRTKQNASR
jgi:hypothetical protein